MGSLPSRFSTNNGSMEALLSREDSLSNLLINNIVSISYSTTAIFELPRPRLGWGTTAAVVGSQWWRGMGGRPIAYNALPLLISDNIYFNANYSWGSLVDCFVFRGEMILRWSSR